MTAPLSAAFNPDRSRVAFTLAHEKGNIITAAMVDALRVGLESIGDNPHLKLITIAGAGPDFSFGASIPEHTADRISAVLPEMHRLIHDLLEAPAVTGAIVRGRCLGGGFELALACDFIFAAEDAVLGLPEIALGVFPPAGSALLPARLGTARSTRAVVTGESRSAAAWRDMGLVEFVAPTDALDAEVDRWFAAHLQPRSAVALRHAAIAARTDLVTRVRQTLPELERLYLDELMRTHDATEGIAAFMARRPADWKNQ